MPSEAVAFAVGAMIAYGFGFWFGVSCGRQRERDGYWFKSQK